MTAPSTAVQVTDLLVLVPITLAANWTVPLVGTVVALGETVTDVTVGGGAGEVTVTGADADLVGSATLVAVTLPLPTVAGAVKSPEEEMLPMDAAQVTDLFVLVP